jgi:hypothetical protein
MPERSLPGDYGLVVKVVNEGQPLRVAAANGFLASFVVVGAEEDYFRAVAARG